jgi:pimeloyl-ACP methyl ester carboxylesterase
MSSIEEEYVEANGLRFKTLVKRGGEKVAILMHGFPDDAGSMRPLMDVVASKGYTAVSPYMRGYGETDRAPDNYLTVKLGHDAVGLADAYDGTETILVGHDWGGNAAYMAAGLAPDRFSKLVALTVPPPRTRTIQRAVDHHPRQFARAWYKLFFQVPEIPEALLRARDFEAIGRLWRFWSPGWEYPKRRLEAVKSTFRKKGTLTAALRYYRDRFRAEYLGADIEGLDEHKRIASKRVPIPALLITGGRDRAIGSELFYDMDDAFEAPRRFVKLPNGGHWFHQEYPDKVSELIAEFLDEY